MVRSILYLAAMLIFASCSQNSGSEAALEQEVAIEETLPQGMTKSNIMTSEQLDSTVQSLVSDLAKVSYLKDIIQEDQRVRKEESAVLQQYGYDSPEHKKAVDAFMAVDQYNLTRLDKFYEVYGGPTKNSVGLMQSEATWYVVHHSSGVDYRNKYFESLKYAYENDIISGGQYTLFLNRWNENQNGERLMMEGSYTEEEEIAKLYDLLGVN